MVHPLTTRRGTAVAALAAVVAVATACSSTDANTPTPATSVQTQTQATSATAAAACRPTVPFTGGNRTTAAAQRSTAQQVAESVTLPAGVSLISGRLSTTSEHPGKIAVAVDLCGGPITTVDALRPVATQLAKAYKASPLSGDMFALYVAHFATYTTTATTGEIKIKDPDFALHLWNGKPSTQAELKQWQVVTG